MRLKNKKTGEIMYWNNEHIPLILGPVDSLKDIIDNWEDMPEEEPKEFWFIDDEGDVEAEGEEYEDALDKMKLIGNYFESKEEAEKAVEKLKAWKRLKDKGFRFVEWQQHGITEDGVMDGAVYFEDAKNIDRADLDLLFGGEE